MLANNKQPDLKFRPKTMKNIIIAMDYSPTAQKVAEAGYSLGKTMSAKVILLHVLSDMVYYSSLDYSPIMGFTGYVNANPAQSETIVNLKAAAQEFLEKAKQHLGDESIQTLIVEGDFAESILQTAKDIKADIIVMGSHSHKWLEKILMGSITEKVLEHSSIPLFIIPTKKHN
jgi:nucleotide-binding universal stress UspA family protein